MSFDKIWAQPKTLELIGPLYEGARSRTEVKGQNARKRIAKQNFAVNECKTYFNSSIKTLKRYLPNAEAISLQREDLLRDPRIPLEFLGANSNWLNLVDAGLLFLPLVSDQTLSADQKVFAGLFKRPFNASLLLAYFDSTISPSLQYQIDLKTDEIVQNLGDLGISKVHAEDYFRNAQRHIVWSARLAKHFGREIALCITSTHEGRHAYEIEYFDSHGPLDDLVDLLNNVIGARLGETYKDLPDEEFVYQLHQALFSGEAYLWHWKSKLPVLLETIIQ